MGIIKEALTFDDVLLLPQYSEVLPAQTKLDTNISKSISLKLPFMSAAMDTVTESKMAISIAKAGGMGVIHRNLEMSLQAKEVEIVKKNIKLQPLLEPAIMILIERNIYWTQV